MKLNTLLQGPPGDWRFKQKESGFPMSAITFGSLLGKIRQHRSNMDYPMVSEGYNTLSDEVEDAICQAMSPEDQMANCNTKVGKVTGIHWKRVGRFLSTMASWFTTNGLQTVPQEEAERRASICAACPLNVGMTGCGACRVGLQAIRVAVLDAHTSQDSILNACGVCGCDNKLQVHAPLAALQSGAPLEYPDWCWKKQTSVPE